MIDFSNIVLLKVLIEKGILTKEEICNVRKVSEILSLLVGKGYLSEDEVKGVEKESAEFFQFVLRSFKGELSDEEFEKGRVRWGQYRKMISFLDRFRKS